MLFCLESKLSWLTKTICDATKFWKVNVWQVGINFFYYWQTSKNGCTQCLEPTFFNHFNNVAGYLLNQLKQVLTYTIFISVINFFWVDNSLFSLTSNIGLVSTSVIIIGQSSSSGYVMTFVYKHLKRHPSLGFISQRLRGSYTDVPPGNEALVCLLWRYPFFRKHPTLHRVYPTEAEF